MSTRSNISILNANGSCEKVYCHFDGYPEYNGIILLNFYKNVEKVRELLSYGDLSVLKKEINPQGKMHSFDKPEENVCIFYGRDRDEKNTCKKTYTTFQKMYDDFEKSYAKYLYVFDAIKNKWFLYMSGIDEKYNLEEYLKNKNNLKH